MAYEIKKSDGTVLTTIGDGFLDTSTSLNLPGPNYVGYGEKLNENLVYMLENFASNIAPLSTSLPGQLWFNTSSSTLNVFTGQGYVPVAGVFTAGIPPAYPKDGDIWYNTNTGQTKVRSDNAWNLIGPNYTKEQGVSGAIPQVIADAASNTINHTVVTLQYGSEIIAVISADDTFTPSPPIFGFPTISPGITFANTIQNAGFRGTVTGNVVSQNNGTVVVNNSGPVGIITGNLIGSVTGNVVGNTVGTHTGSVLGATTVNTGTLSATGNITAGNVSATNLTGILNTPAQTNITSIGTLSGLTVAGVTNLLGTATLNGIGIATLGGSASFTSINATPIGNVIPSTASFTQVISGAIQAQAIGNVTPGSGRFTTITTGGLLSPTIGNTGASLVGTVSTASQPNITGVGTITTGLWQASTVQPTYGGTGVNNGVNTLTITGGGKTLDQEVYANASPRFIGTNFYNIPASAIIGGGGGGAVSSVTGTGTVSGITLSANQTTGAVTLTLGGSLNLTSGAITSALGFTPYSNANPNNYLSSINYTQVINALGYTPYNSTNPNGYVGASALSGYLTSSGTLTGTLNTSNACYTGNFSASGWIRATGDVTAFYGTSDRRLKENIVPITGALGKVLLLNGYHYNYKHANQHINLIGLMADEVEPVAPELVYESTPVGVDEDVENPYKALRYELAVPLLVEAIKELNAKIEALEARLAKQ